MSPHAPRGGSEDTDEVTADTTPEFRQAAKAVIIVDICCRAEDRTAEISNAHEIKDRKAFIRRFHQKIDVAVVASLVTRDGAIEEQLAYAERAELLTAVAWEAEGVISFHALIEATTA